MQTKLLSAIATTKVFTKMPRELVSLTSAMTVTGAVDIAIAASK